MFYLLMFLYISSMEGHLTLSLFISFFIFIWCLRDQMINQLGSSCLCIYSQQFHNLYESKNKYHKYICPSLISTSLVKST